MSSLAPFHLAFPVHDLEQAREFYTEALGAGTGRETDSWIDFDLFGHQIVAHYKEGMESGVDIINPVDGHDVPVPHFGVILSMDKWKTLSERLRQRPNTRWVIEPTIRFEGRTGEQATFFVLDPSGNALEFKAFADMSSLFAT